jgi:uncharacterized protein YciI
MAYYLVTVAWGPARNPAASRREQLGWDEHAAFMDELVRRGVVVLGGPAGTDIDTGDAALLVSAADEAAAREALADDPWQGSMLIVKRVQQWTIWLRAPALA